jgi:hypothetical protein
MPPFRRPAIRTLRMTPQPMVSPLATQEPERASSMPPTVPSDGLIPSAFPAVQRALALPVSRPSSPTIAVPDAPEAPAAEHEHDTSRPQAFDSIDGIARSEGALHVKADDVWSTSSEESISTPMVPSRFDGAIGAWKRASLPKRAIALLMLPALLGSFFTLRPPATVAAEPVAITTPRSAVVAAPVASSLPKPAPSAAAVAPVATVASEPKGPVKESRAGLHDTRSAERRALDTVASGLEASASEQYDALAGAHPENVAFREAARILRERSATTSHD